MDLAQLRTFVEVAKRRSFVAAARALGVSQPAVSRQVQALERELGAKLVERGGVTPALTPAGEDLLRYAQGVLDGYDALLARLGQTPSELAGQLQLAASTIPGEYLLPAIIASFVASHPRVSVSLAVANTLEVVERVADRRCQVGFVGYPERRPGVRLREVCEDEVVCIAPADHPLVALARVPLSALLAEHLILREAGSGTMHTVETALAARGHELPHENVRLVLGSTNAVVAAVEAGLGLGFVSALAVAEARRRARVAALRLEGRPLTRHLYLAYDEDALRAPLARAFVEHLDEWLASRRDAPGG